MYQNELEMSQCTVSVTWPWSWDHGPKLETVSRPKNSALGLQI